MSEDRDELVGDEQDMDGQSLAGEQEVEHPPLEERPKRKRRSSNYALESKMAGTENGWAVIRDGFVSPEQAIEYIVKAKLTGTFRAIRVASEEYVAETVTPEPVWTVKKVKKVKS